MKRKLSQQHTKFSDTLSSKVLSVVLVVLILFIGVSAYRNVERQADVTQELSRLEAEVSELEGRKVELADMIVILESREYVEREARVRLGMRREGERVVSIPENARPASGREIEAEELGGKRSNLSKWFEYFFENE